MERRSGAGMAETLVGKAQSSTSTSLQPVWKRGHDMEQAMSYALPGNEKRMGVAYVARSMGIYAVL